ncbi:hypothetical protein LTR70_008958 [Exophiala xenobiotica]|uniref:Apple domain-containing protein n=1 Tax=Lithohypha guttulata TaxID=1690604 RepID=A0ABR0JZB3_9EURO|nr:hypothetical protein LTR24_008694 [Lithohypha guttulata]KAK5311195.1 hypothetical protein LTR70_008958 [Exophiala xenobiotica]
MPGMLVFLLLGLPVVKAQSEACPSNPTVFQQDNLTVDFTTFCGADIDGADFEAPYGKLSERTFTDCIVACAQYQPLCYGFDYTPYKEDGSTNCWLKSESFADSAVAQATFAVNAAKLDLSSLPTMLDDCSLLGQQTNTESSIYTVYCGVDLSGGNIRKMPATSMAQCLALCDQTADCVGLAYESSAHNGPYNCFLKGVDHGGPVTIEITTINAATKQLAVVAPTSSSSSESAPSSQTPTPTSSEPPSSTAATSSSPTTSTPDSGLSTGAKVGIGVGVGVGALTAALLVGWYVMRRRRTRAAKINTPPMTQTERHLPSELEQSSPHPQPELESSAQSYTTTSTKPIRAIQEMGA